MIPAAYHTTKNGSSTVDVAAIDSHSLSPLNENAQWGLLIISRGTAILLLGVYIAYLFFQLKTHASLFVPKKRIRYTLLGDESATVVEEEDGETAKMSVVAAGVG